MNLRVQPQEIYLLERYISLEYFGDMRDRWEAMIVHLDACLASYMHDLPPRYRAQSLSEQPDVAWGHRVLPNFRATLQGLNEGYIRLSHGDFLALRHACGPLSDHKGQMDYSTAWLSKADESVYQQHLDIVATCALNISATEAAHWEPFDLLNYPKQRGLLHPPAQWPTYQVNRDVRVASGNEVERCGIYVPDMDDSSAQFLSTRYEAPLAGVCVGMQDQIWPDTGKKWGETPIVEQRSCTWYLVERVDGAEGTALQSSGAGLTRRHQAGETCKADGFYFTPAHSDSRRFFRKGELFPDSDAAYGNTIWQRDDAQA